MTSVSNISHSGAVLPNAGSAPSVSAGAEETAFAEVLAQAQSSAGAAGQELSLAFMDAMLAQSNQLLSSAAAMPDLEQDTASGQNDLLSYLTGEGQGESFSALSAMSGMGTSSMFSSGASSSSMSMSAFMMPAISALMEQGLSADSEKGLQTMMLGMCLMMTCGMGDQASSLMSRIVTQYLSEQGDGAGSAASEVSGRLLSSARTYSSAAFPVDCWKPCTPPLFNDVSARDARNYRYIIDQFYVENNIRYANNKTGQGDTYCNIFMWDVTSAMGAEIPHYVYTETGEPTSYPPREGVSEMDSNAIHDWLLTEGGKYGWYEVTAEQAQAFADSGRPAMTVWQNPSGRPGHVQIVCPGRDGAYDPAKGVTVAQAGTRISNYMYARQAFTAEQYAGLRYFAHN